MSEALSHIRRSPLPWRESELTECGRPVSEMAKVVDWQEARRLTKEYGRQRFALLFCMTCTYTTDRWPTWDSDPLERLSRERRGNEELVQRELRVIAALIAAHRDEFDEALAGFDTVGDLAARRGKKRRSGGDGS